MRNLPVSLQGYRRERGGEKSGKGPSKGAVSKRECCREKDGDCVVVSG